MKDNKTRGTNAGKKGKTSMGNGKKMNYLMGLITKGSTELEIHINPETIRLNRAGQILCDVEYTKNTPRPGQKFETAVVSTAIKVNTNFVTKWNKRVDMATRKANKMVTNVTPQELMDFQNSRQKKKMNIPAA